MKPYKLAKELALLAAAAALMTLPARAMDVGSEIVSAQTHADLAGQAVDLDNVHMHLHHALNCLVGPNGNGFDPKQLNPCEHSGSGAIPDTTQSAKRAVLEDAAEKARHGIGTMDIVAAKKDAADISTMLKKLKNS